jgi:hypothetical protein
MVCDMELQICKKYRAIKPKQGSRYASGQARCQICEIFMKWSGLRCPCCKTQLRRKPRNVIYKDKMKEQVDLAQFNTYKAE